jgi:hypothetical protein
MKPKLKQFGDLSQSDFDEYPVWVGVHTMDYDEDWYEESDEETFRPWIGEFPVNPNLGIFLVRSRFTLNDHSDFVGFITPAIGNGNVRKSDHGTVQPHLFISTDKKVSFWGGMFGFSDDARQATYELLDRTPRQIFPIRFNADRGYTHGRQSGKIQGFYKCTNLKKGKITVSR